MSTIKSTLSLSKETIRHLKTKTGMKAGGGTCDNACGNTSDACTETATNCPPPPPPPPPEIHFLTNRVRL